MQMVSWSAKNSKCHWSLNRDLFTPKYITVSIIHTDMTVQECILLKSGAQKKKFFLWNTWVAVHVIIIIVIIMWTTEKPSQKNNKLTSQLSGSVIGSNGLIYSKSRAWCHSFQPVKELYLCFCCFRLAVFNNCWSTTTSFSFLNYYTK